MLNCYRYAYLLGFISLAWVCCSGNTTYRATLICEDGSIKVLSGDCCSYSDVAIGYTAEGWPCNEQFFELSPSQFPGNWQGARFESVAVTCVGATRPAIVYTENEERGWKTEDRLTCLKLRGGEALGTNAVVSDDFCRCNIELTSSEATEEIKRRERQRPAALTR
jgi:hypothetical protein